MRKKIYTGKVNFIGQPTENNIQCMQIKQKIWDRYGIVGIKILDTQKVKILFKSFYAKKSFVNNRGICSNNSF